ncbi:hypothetical protein HYH03_004180 [Edaphochlamys debaryana]|uniref:Pyruvate kinase n=1 Tax=Edaphochlamys debaryana TaxID=47281 RepID=A0A835YBR7_9CHLO|nr:hypothetical protein HYH03_004180 [Edaphochlamys debaryana]|eukprot:KAG2497916.1 hypothetical protein HYH03_004180 [Edaphochlamys debaryana]
MRGSGGGSRYYRAKSRPHFFQDLNLNTILQPADPTEGCFVASKVCATLGPSCSDVDTLCSLLEAGMTVARVDLTWGPLDYHKRSLRNLSAAMKRVRRMCAVMVDTLGRELLIKRPFKLGPDGWPLHDTPFKVTSGSPLTITTRDLPATPALLPITYPKFPSLVQPGDIVYIGRYLACGAPEQASLYLQVDQVHTDSGDVLCTALNDAELNGLLTVFNLERSASELVSLQSDLPVLTDYDKQALRELADGGSEIDFVSISYCRSGADVKEVRAFAESVPGLAAAAMVAKVETRQALFNFRGILDAADGITISRGLLGLDCVPEKVALIQKQLVSACNLVGKPVMVTRVLDSMENSPRPTRAEATDVANAVLDGADALFLGAETLRGRYPVDTVRTLVSIARQAERVFDFRHHFEWLMQAAMDAQELRDALASGSGPGFGGFGGSVMGGFGGFGGATLDDDDAATDIFMLAGGGGGSQMGFGFGSVGAGLSGLGGGHQGSHHGGQHGGRGDGYGHVGGLTPLASVGDGLAGVGGGGGREGGGGLSPASTNTNLEELAAAEGGGATPTGGALTPTGAHHVSFSGLPPKPPTRTRSNASMPDIPGGAPASGADGGNGGPPAGERSISATGAGGGAQGQQPSSGTSRSHSYADINTAVAAMARFGDRPGGGHPLPGAGSHLGPHAEPHHGHTSHHGHSHHAHSRHGHGHASGRASPSVRSNAGTVYGGGPSGPYMGKLESIASSAVRAAEKVKASLIVVYTHTSRVAQLVAKYRPPMPILTLVVPRLTSDGLHWKLQGRGHARQCLLVRGLLPMLSAPGPSGDEVLEEAIAMSSRLGLVGPGHHVVVVERVHDAFCLKIVAVDELGLGIDRGTGMPYDPAAVVVRSMVPATPVVGRTLSMMNDARLPSAAMLAAAARGASGGGAGNGVSGGGGFSPAAMGTVMGAVTSLLSASPSVYDAPDGGYGRPRRLTSRELIMGVPNSPTGPLAAGSTAAAPATLLAGVGLVGSTGGASPGSGIAASAGGGGVSPGVRVSDAKLPVLNALGGGTAAQDGLMAAAAAPLARGGGLGPVAEEPEGRGEA